MLGLANRIGVMVAGATTQPARTFRGSVPRAAPAITVSAASATAIARLHPRIGLASSALDASTRGIGYGHGGVLAALLVPGQGLAAARSPENSVAPIIGITDHCADKAHR